MSNGAIVAPAASAMRAAGAADETRPTGEATQLARAAARTLFIEARDAAVRVLGDAIVATTSPCVAIGCTTCRRDCLLAALATASELLTEPIRALAAPSYVARFALTEAGAEALKAITPAAGEEEPDA